MPFDQMTIEGEAEPIFVPKEESPKPLPQNALFENVLGQELSTVKKVKENAEGYTISDARRTDDYTETVYDTVYPEIISEQTGTFKTSAAKITCVKGDFR